MDRRVILEDATGAPLLALELSADIMARLAGVRVARGLEAFWLPVSPRPVVITPPPSQIYIPAPADPVEEREGWRCPTSACSALVDVQRDACPWCETPRPSAE